MMLSLAHTLVSARASGASFVGPLDDYAANLAGAWSVSRRLLSSYSGPLIRVRRSSDNDELDIGTSGITQMLNTAALSAFIGANNGFLSVIYDESGLGRNLEQATASLQRRIVLNGTIDTLGGQPTAKATGNQGYATAAFATTTGTHWSLFARASIANDLAYDRILSGGLSSGSDFVGGAVIAFARNDSNASILSWSGLQLATLAITYDQQFIGSSIFDGVNSTLAIGGADDSFAFTGAISLERFFAGMQSAATAVSGVGSCFSEAAIYNADKSSDEAAIRTALTP
jgi:hypothetical protein